MGDAKVGRKGEERREWRMGGELELELGRSAAGEASVARVRHDECE